MVRSAIAMVFGVLLIAGLGTMANAVVFHGAPSPAPMPVPLELLLLLMHALAAFAGGYMAASVARRRPVMHGFAVGVLYLLLAQVVPEFAGHLSPAPAVQPLWSTALALGVALLAAAAGGAARGQAAGSRS